MSKLIIFDCDGVLADSEIIANRVDSQHLTRAGYPISVEETVRRFTGMSIDSIQDYILKDTGLILHRDFFVQNQQLIVEAVEKEVQPLMLPLLSNALMQNTPKCIASNAPRKRVLMSLQATRQHTFFKEEHIFTAEQVAHPKPAPDLFLFAAQTMGHSPGNCLVIEDSLVGIEAAVAAKIPVVGFLGGTHAQFPWYKARIQACNIPVVHTSLELLSFIENWMKGGLK